ncbi:MAG: outer membrane beta-barrel protein [Ferruginibacter sp.]|nr:outer membrane beta-barrel protein [Ferruginibacter sp.]
MHINNISLLIVIKNIGKSILCLLWFCFNCSFCFAQNASGKLSGKITDAGNNQTLNAANIVAKSIKKGTQSITDGTYILSLPVGTYTISYSYTGYQQKDIKEVEIKAGETTYLQIALEKASSQMSGVVITSTVKREAVSAIYNKQKVSAAASDGISIEAIRKTPDANVGQIMKRVTGVNVQDNRFVVVRGLGDQYNQTMLNGVLMTSTESNRNAFALDLIPAAVLDNIIVNKTATPDMPGNFAGGIVQINTKEFPATDFISVLLGTGFSDQTLGKPFYGDKRAGLELLAFGSKDRDLPKNFPTKASRLGNIRDLNVLEQQRYLRTLTNNLAPIAYGNSKPNEGVQIGYGKTIKFSNARQIGIVAAITQRKTELFEEEIIARDAVSDVKRGGTKTNRQIEGLRYYSENKRYRYSADFGGVLNIAYRFGNNKITLKNLYTQISNNTFTERPVMRLDNRYGNNLEGPSIYGITYFPEQKKIINTILSGEHRVGKDNDTRIEWNLNATINNSNTPDIRNFVFTKDSNSVLRISSEVSDAEKALEIISRVWSRDKDYIFGGAFNITSPFTLFKNKQLFKAGMLFQNRIRKTSAVIISYQGISGTIDNILAPESLYGGPNISPLTDISTSNGTYDAGSSLLAAYESLENKIANKLRIIWGIRAEKYQQYVNVFNPFFYTNFRDFDVDIQGLAAKTSFNFLPSVNFVYALKKSINIRPAYSKTVARPELKDLAAFPRYDYRTYVISQGNPGLRTTTIQNFDLKFEIFPSAGEIISVAAFYKKLKDPIEYARLFSQEQRVSPLNVGDAYVQGVEAEIRKKIDFLTFAPWLKNVTVFGNGTLLKSKVSTQILNDLFYPSIEEHTLTGQPGYIINAGINISAFKNTFEATFSYNRTGDYIYQLGAASRYFILANGEKVLQIPHSRVNPRDLMDVTVSKDFFKNKCRLKLNVSNLLNSKYIVYQDINENGKLDEPIIVDITKPELVNSYISGVDNTTSSIKAQRTYSLSVSYTF